MKSVCLLIVDVQQALIDEHPHDEAAFLERLTQLLAAARTSGVTIAYVQHADPAGEPLEPGTAGWALADAIKPRAAEPVFAKKFNSSFKETELESWLDKGGIETLIVVGMQTEYCLDATIKSAFEKGYSSVVPEGCHTTFANGEWSAVQVKEFYQNIIWNRRYASVEPIETVLGRFNSN